MSCIIHYEHEKTYDDQLTHITEQTKARILEAKSKHEKNDDGHLQQCCMIPGNEDLKNCKYHLNPCYKKFTRILVTRSEDTKIFSKQENKTPSVKSKSKRPTRSSSSKILPGLPPVKRRRTHNPKEGFVSPSKLRLRSSSFILSSPSLSPLATNETFQTISPTVPSQSKHIYGPECVICKKYELVHFKQKGKIRSYPVRVTLLNAAEKIKQCAKEKEKYKDLYHEIIGKDLIAAEFKCHEECRKDLTRSVREKSHSQRGNPSGDFTKVTNYVDEYVLSMNQAVGLNVLMNIYFDTDDDCLAATLRKRRFRFKNKISRYYGDQIMILETTSNSSAVIINSATVNSKVTVTENHEELIKQAAKYIRSDIEEYCKEIARNPSNWPPNIEELMSNERLPPPSVSLFLTNLLKSSNRSVTKNIRKLVESYSSDFIHSVSKGEVLTPKHFLLGISLHNMTGQRKIVQIANRLGHSISYDKVLDIETAYARKAQKTIETSEHSILPLKPATMSDTVTTVFWADNFDQVSLSSITSF